MKKLLILILLFTSGCTNSFYKKEFISDQDRKVQSFLIETTFDNTPYADMSTSSFAEFIEKKQTKEFINAFKNPVIKESENILIKEYKTKVNNYFDYSIIFPEFKNIKNKDTQDDINIAIENMAKGYMSGLFKNTSPDPDDYGLKFKEKKQYKSFYKNERLISVIFSNYSYKGGVHGYEFTEPFNYDYILHKNLSLEDVFKKDTDYLGYLSSGSHEYLIKNGSAMEKDLVKNGTEPDKENFKLFSFGEKFITFYFPAYQVGCYAAGEYEVVMTYEELKPFLRNEYLNGSEK